MSMVKILITEPEYFNEKAISILKSVGEVEAKHINRNELLQKISEVDVLVTRVETNIDKELLGSAKKLQVVATATTGVDHIDVEEAKRCNIEVINAPGANATATAEHAFALMLSLLRKIPFAFNSIQNGIWNRSMFFGHECDGKTLGVIGFGRIGMKFSRYARALGMNIIAFDPFIDQKIIENEGATPVGLEKLISDSDVITLHTFLSKETQNMFDTDKFQKMKRNAILINASRGQIINDQALINALNDKLIAGAALDVFSNEPLKQDNPLVVYAKNHDNLLLTPHIAGSTLESIDAAAVMVANKVVEYLQKSSSQGGK